MAESQRPIKLTVCLIFIACNVKTSQTVPNVGTIWYICTCFCISESLTDFPLSHTIQGVPNLVRTFEYESLLFFVYDILGNRLLKFIFCDSLLVNICVPDRPPFFYDSATSFHSLAAAATFVMF
jgi:hypothetical protein